MNVDSLGNVLGKAEESKDDKVARVTIAALKDRKAENAAETHNKEIDGKIESIKSSNY